jgi:hypothetical protein
MASENFWTAAYGDDEPVSKQANASKEPTPEPKTSGKRDFLKNLIRSGSKKLVRSGSQRLDKVIRSASIRRRGQSSTADSARTSTIPKSPSEIYQARFDAACPESIAELLEALDQGRHPEILKMAIDHGIHLSSTADHDRASRRAVLNSMLEVLKEKQESGDLDHIQRKTLEQLGRVYDEVQFM